MKLSQRISQVETSRTVRFSSLIDKMKREGREIINFAVGEPEYETPEHIRQAVKAALDRGETRYGPVAGLHELRSALSRPFAGYGPENILVANGSKQILYNIFQVICDPGDEVIIPSPYWVSFSQQVILAGGKPVLVNTRNHQLDYDAVEKAVTAKTAAILVNSPNNPTGAVYPKNDLKRIADLARKHALWLISDEAYEFFLYDGLRFESLFAFENIRNRVIVVKSFSKSCSMTGFRIGYAAGPKEIVAAMSKLQSHATGNVCTFAQHGALAALSLDQTIISARRAELEKKRDIAYGYLSEIFYCIRPQGAFYLFPDISGYLRTGETDEDFSAYLLEHAGVAVVPGQAFGQEKHIRISYAVPEKDLIRGLESIRQALDRKGQS
ncbi:MAG: pyridoxal phosphate-dependent aminotransferase [Desulfobacterales bacterium]